MTEEMRQHMARVLMGTGLEPGSRAYTALEEFVAGEVLRLEGIVDQALAQAHWLGFNAGAQKAIEFIELDKAWYAEPCGCKQRLPAFVFCAEHAKELRPGSDNGKPVKYGRQ